MKKSYSELLKDPHWQKKRLEILQRDEFKCRSCNDDISTLHVHHLRYDSKLLPWEYDNDDLITLCESCHKVWGMIDQMLKASDYGWEHVGVVVDLYNRLEMESIEKYLKELEKQGKIIEPTGSSIF
jgi:hypothetical protein